MNWLHPPTGEQPNKIVGHCRIIDNNEIYNNRINNNDYKWY